MFKHRKSTASQDAPRKESIATTHIRTQVAGEAPVQKTVKVAVMPPRLPPGMAPPTRVGAADVFSWDEPLNWSHNEKIRDDKTPPKKDFFGKIGLTTERKKANPNTPNFTFREVPYDVWRKHYAKDKDGNYRGTLAPAEDCILNPDDLLKWRLDEPETEADRFTRGKHVLPVYDQVEQEDAAPTYTDASLNEEDAKRVSSLASSGTPAHQHRTSSFTADGKTTEEIIAEAEEKERTKPKLTMKERLKGVARDAIAGEMGQS